MGTRNIAMNQISFLGDIYIFGIWSGCSTYDIIKYLKENKIKYDKIYGFDSFKGFPVETADIDRCVDFTLGEYSSTVLYDEPDTRKVMNEIYRGIGENKLRFYDGFYSDILNKDLVEKENMKSASYVDIDVDLHISTVELLTWMFDNKLICKGTVIYFDDWGSTRKYTGGESLAWKQIVEKYNIKYSWIVSETYMEMEGQKVFVVEDICASG